MARNENSAHVRSLCAERSAPDPAAPRRAEKQMACKREVPEEDNSHGRAGIRAGNVIPTTTRTVIKVAGAAARADVRWRTLTCCATLRGAGEG